MIYYVEDDINIRELTLYALKQAGYEAEGFAHATPFFEACAKVKPDLILLDIMLPEIDGIQILKKLREDLTTQYIPVMMLTAKGTEYDTVRGLDAGADDYLAKPFGMMELISRVNALLRRAQTPAIAQKDSIEAGPVEISLVAHTVTIGGVPVALTLKEFDLLSMLVENEGHVLTRAQLLEGVWDITYIGETRTVDVHIQTLRQKMEKALEGSGALINTVRGVGYSFSRE